MSPRGWGLGLAWSGRVAPSCGTDGNQWKSVGTLSAGASATFSFTGLPAGSVGTKTFRAFVDSYYQATESNEANHQTTTGYTVGSPIQPPDFVVTSRAISPMTLIARGTFTATVTVKNQGAGPGNGVGWIC